ncbi:hypothetical protein GIB67_031611 [Kingdonia uniflora]|uniref:Protein kinase domain-containing protein n=1 Tax=Kingdonia uniflora TaxID=39325 RepID=A0A7J7LYK0_9MAGN|nr:hypothetical protein GIB67_031611 [Kingdonia uniflora]
MTIDQTYIPKDLRPLNLAPTMAEPAMFVATSVASAATVVGTGRNVDGGFLPNYVYDVHSPTSRVVYYSVSEAGPGYAGGGVGFGDPVNGVNPVNPAFAWYSRPPAMVVSSNGVSGYGFTEVPGFVNRGDGVGGGNASNGTMVNNQAREEGLGLDLEDQSLMKKVKILCSFGGKILPRPSDGMLRYVGGHTRIITVRRTISFHELVQKMIDTYGQPVVIKYQLPDEDLDALVSVSNPEDLENMMEEYGKLVESSLDGSAKIRVFLFSASELDPSGLLQFGDVLDIGKRYLDAVNGISDGASGGTVRKESVASATSTQNSDGLVSGGEALDSTGGGPTSPVVGEVATNFMYVTTGPVMHAEPPPLVTDPPQTLPFSRHEPELERLIPSIMQQQQPLGINAQQPSGMNYPPSMAYMPSYVDPQQEVFKPVDYPQPSPQVGYRNPPMFAVGGQVYRQFDHPQQLRDNVGVPQQFIPAVRMTPQQSQTPVDPYNIGENTFGARVVQLQGDQIYRTYQPQPLLSQTSGAFQVGGGHGWRQVTPADHMVFSDGLVSRQHGGIYEKLPMLEDCYMCQKALPHAHSDTVVQDYRDNIISPNSDSSPVFHSLRLENNNIGSRPLNRVVVSGALGEGTVEHQGSGARSRIAAPQLVTVGFSPDSEIQNDTSKSDNSDYSRIMPPQSTMGIPSDSNPQYGVFVGNIPQSHQGDSLQQPSEQFSYHQVGPNIRPVRIIPLQASEFTAQESSVEYYVKHPGFLLNEDFSQSSNLSERLRPIDRKPYPPSNIGIQHPISDEMWHDKPAFSAIDSIYATDKNLSSGDWKDRDSSLTSRIISDEEIGRPSGNTLPPMDGIVGDIEPSQSNSLFSNQDPWTLQHDMHLVPPRPSKVLMGKEASVTKDEGILHNPSFDSERGQSNKGSAEENIKQELQAVAEGVAALVLQPSISSDSSAPYMNEVISDASQDRRVHDNNDVKTKLPDKTSPSLPIESIGRLQIIKNSDLEELRELGSGTFGTVYHGKWRGSDVAIKRINERCFAGKPLEQDQMRDDFWNEAIKLADLHHPNVVAFYGVVVDSPGGSVATVTEYMVNGSLRQALQRNDRALDKRKSLFIAMDVAFGMEYLHGRNIVHFDLKSDNLLVNLRDPHRPICKVRDCSHFTAVFLEFLTNTSDFYEVGDLGLSKVKCQTLISGGVRGTLPWMAPELLNGSSSLVSEKVDVFSFGIVMWELLTGEEPYADLHYGAIIGGIVSNTLRPPVPESCDVEWRSLMEKCWSSEPPERPSFTEIANCLRALAASIPSKGQAAQQQQK